MEVFKAGLSSMARLAGPLESEMSNRKVTGKGRVYVGFHLDKMPFEWLKYRAGKEHITMSALVRRLVTGAFLITRLKRLRGEKE